MVKKTEFISMPNEFTLWRFAEIEVLKAYENLYKACRSKEKAIDILVTMLDLNEKDPNTRDAFLELFSHRKYRPSKPELVNYFRYLGYGVNRIFQVSGMAANTVRKYQQEKPQFPPKQMVWRELYPTWEHVRKHVKLFD